MLNKNYKKVKNDIKDTKAHTEKLKSRHATLTKDLEHQKNETSFLR